MNKKKNPSLIDTQDENMYRFLTENITDVIWIMDVETRKFVYMSPSVEKLRGYSVEEVMAQDVFQALCPPYQKILQHKIAEQLARYKKTGKKESFKDEVQQPCKDGSIIWTEIISHVRINPKNKRVELIGTTRDISDRKKAEEKLAYREMSIRKILERTAGKKGQDYFSEMAKVMEEVTNASYSFIGEKLANNSVRTIALSHQATIMDNFTYDLYGTPCENVSNQESCVYPRDVAKQFPEDQLLTDMGIEAYAGTSISNHKGEQLGIIVSLYDKPIEDSSFTKSVFEIFSIRIGSEMERLSTEKALEESEARYKMLSDLSKEGIVIHDHGKILNLNKAFCELYGYSAEELLAMDNPLSTLMPSESEKIAQEKIETQFEGVYFIMGIKKDGTHFPMETDGGKIIYENKKVRVAIFRDVTAQKEAEEKAFKLSKAVEQSPECIVITNKEGIIEYVNPRFEEITGFTKEEAIGQTPNMLSSGEHDELFYKNIWEHIDAGKTWYGEFLNKKKNGELYWENASISPLINDQGETTHYVAVKEDITEKKKILKDLRLAKEKAEESDRLKSAFLASMSHEIRTPLNAIVGFSNIIAESSEDPELIKFSDLIVRQNDLLLQIIDDIIDFARVESGNIELNYQSFCLGNLINEVYLHFRSKCPKEIKIITEVAQDTLYVNSDKHRIRQVFINLISNAIKFTRRGNITFGFRFDKDDVIICFVSDTGVGIPKEQQANIFHRFTKLDSFTQGTGLGLSIIHYIIKLMGGKIWLDSELDKGSNFYFKIPFKTKDKPIKPIKMEIKEKTKRPKKNQTVLIVEDDESNYLFLKELISSLNMNILHVINGYDAIDVCKKNNIDLILMDLKLPGLDGYQATTEIKKLNPNLPIIAQTAYALKGDDIKAKEAGCDEYLTKPIRKENLFKLINKYL